MAAKDSNIYITYISRYGESKDTGKLNTPDGRDWLW